MHWTNNTLLLLLLISLTCCKDDRNKVPATIETPWGATIHTAQDDSEEGTLDIDTAASHGVQHMSLHDIQQGGEMIMLTLTGPDTYYDYHGRGLGAQYLLCERLAKHLGVSLRVDLCADTTEMLSRLRNGEGDVIAFPLQRRDQVGFIDCADHWAVNKYSQELARAIRKWYKPQMLAEVKKQEQQWLASGGVMRRVYPFMLAPGKGQISSYDVFFRKHAATAGVDWIMLAAQCYQESCFDPKAYSWAGACGLMQIMPATADHLNLPRNQIYEPEPNIAAAARYMRELQGIFSDVSNPTERLKFALAAYNGGYYHIRDAMSLARKYGGVPQRWDDVKRYVLLLSSPTYYRDPVVKNGYMRGSETVNYVDMIMQRHAQYRQALSTGGKVISTVKSKHYDAENFQPPTSGAAAAHRAAKKNKWRKE